MGQNRYLDQFGPCGASNKEPAFLLRKVRTVLVKRLNHVYARVKMRQDNVTMSILVPTAVLPEIEQGVSLDIVVTPKYAPLKETSEFILLAVKRPGDTADKVDLNHA